MFSNSIQLRYKCKPIAVLYITLTSHLGIKVPIGTVGQEAFYTQPTSWTRTSQEKSSSHPSLELLQPREQYKGLDRPMPGMETNAQPRADHRDSMGQPAASPTRFRKCAHQHTWSKTPHPKPSAPLVMLQTVTQGARTPATGLWLPIINTQASSRLHTPDRCEFCHLHQDHFTTFCPQLQSK